MRPTSDVAIGFTPLTAGDLPLLHVWLGREHVRRWWGEPGSYEDVLADYLPSIERRDPTDLYAIRVDDVAVGLVQAYLVDDHPERASLLDVGAHVAGIDLLIGEVELTGRGLGGAVIRAFTETVVFSRPATRSCIGDPDVRNLASIRSFAKAGFARVRDFRDPEDGQLHALLRAER